MREQMTPSGAGQHRAAIRALPTRAELIDSALQLLIEAHALLVAAVQALDHAEQSVHAERAANARDLVLKTQTKLANSIAAMEAQS